MFQKQTFGAANTGFGSFNAGASTSSPFGGFKLNTGTSAFGAPPAFGANATTQPATGGGLFGSTNTSTGLFGSTPATSTFGTSSGFGFGANTSTGGLFNNSSGGGLFGNNQANTSFGAKPNTGFGFGSPASTNTTGGIFGSTPSTSTGLFGQQNTAMNSGGLFGGTTAGFGQTQATGTAHVKYNPVVGTDIVVKGGNSQNVNIKHHCITCMKEYEGKSLEELRLEDYVAGRKGSTTGVFSFQQTENKPLFGGSTFGQPATTSAPSLFGGSIGTTPAFGQTSTFSFGGNAPTNTNTTGLFGAAKPAFGATGTTGTGLFGATTTQAPAFGTNTSTFGFGSNTQNQTTGGIFGAKPATTGFGATPASTGFGAFGGGGLFGAKPQQTTAPTFGSTAPAFGSTTGFGTSTTGSGLFGSTFGKPATTQPSFGFNSQPTLGTGLGTGLGTSFQAKPAATGFGTLGTGSLFQQPNQNNTFRTGLDSGLGGGGLFGNTSSLGGTSLGLGQLNANNSSLTGNLSGASVGGNVHEQILALAARPYGDTPLFKDLVPDNNATAEDILKPTNPAAVKAVLENSSYRVTSPPCRLKLLPRPITQDKKSLFDGLEESDPSLEDKLSLKPSRKRLVLRPKRDDADRSDNRSLEETRADVNSNTVEDRQTVTNDFSVQENNKNDTNHVDVVDSNSDRHGSWLSSPQVWPEKEKSIDGEGTPRLYPNLEKELPAQVSERRASWLTTKPLRKPLVSNPESAENTVRELAIRPSPAEDKENIDTPGTSNDLNFCCHRWGELPGCSNCEKIVHRINGIHVSEGENLQLRNLPPHPAGVKLTRPGYYTIPSLEEMIKYIRPDGSCVLPHLTIGRKNYGNVYYDSEIDVAGLDMDGLVHFLNKEVIIYPDDEQKPPVGAGLNRRAIVTLERVWPRDKTERRPVTEPDRLLKMDYEGKLRRVCDKHDTKFIEYRPQTGSWVFRVEHFSKYGLTDSDEEDDITPDVLKRQLVNQNLQKSAAPAPKLPVPTTTAPLMGLGGLGGLGGSTMPGLGEPSGLVSEDLFAMQQSSLNLMNGSSKAFDMDTAEESPSLYQDRALGVKSPTSELARLEQRQSHHVQLMKASLYADIEMEEDVSISTGDQQVPRASAMIALPVERTTTLVTRSEIEIPQAIQTEEIAMRPLIMNPHTVVLKFHRKVPPFKHTIAGRLDASCIADMSICRARHSRIGFGPASTLSFVSTYEAINDLPKITDLSELFRYVRGRTDEDWSESVVARISMGRTSNNTNQTIMTRQLASLLEFSEATQSQEHVCVRLVVQNSPADRRRLLQKLLEDASSATGKTSFGVSSEYCLQVWKLCDALWGADLDNDGVPGTDEHSIVNRHTRLLEWFKEALATVTDRKLAESKQAEPEDESDFHSARVLTLLLGGRILEACKLCRESGDLNMATLIAQCSGDPAFKSLISRQMHTWNACGAWPLVAESRRNALQLIGGKTAATNSGWLTEIHAAARYITPQIPTLEQIIRSYESRFSSEEEVDLTTLPDDDMMEFPTPPYLENIDVTVNGKTRRVLDLRYELLRARAFNTRPRLSPSTYTPDPFDYSLSFMLGSWLGQPSVDSIVGAAEQLQAQGDWHLAVQVLAYHPDDVARGHLIRSVLSRYAPSQADTPELKSRLDLIKKLGIPEKWLLIAQAHRAKYERKPSLEVEHLVGAQQWNAAHRVLIDELLPAAVLSDNLQNIKGVLEKMNEAAARHEVSGWESGGQALYNYLKVCDEIRGLVTSVSRFAPGGVVATRLESLRPALAAACRSLKGLTASTPRHAAARSEMGARLIQLALAGGEPPPHLAAMLRHLRLPPDCAAAARDAITKDLAEQASEMCIDSAQSSPISSHHRTALKS